MADVIPQASRPSKAKDGKIKTNGKKRTRNPQEWQKEKQKKLRIAGKEHISTMGKRVPEKKPGPDCNCKKKCYEKVPEEARLKIFEGYYAMTSRDAQNSYLFGLIRRNEIKRKTKKEGSRRTCSYEYCVRLRGKEIVICQTAFKNIHAITERKVRVLCKKMDDGVMAPVDNRGKNSGCMAGEIRLPNEIIDQIKNHIYSIVNTHRLKDFIRYDKVTGVEVNITKMWKDYIREYDPDNLHYVLNKGKKTLVEEPQAEIQIQQQIIQNDAKNLTYPGSGYLISYAENYFSQSMNSSQPQLINNYHQAGEKIAYYQETPAIQYVDAVINTLQNSESTLTIMQPGKAVKNKTLTPQKKKDPKTGPLVKHWRYANIFREEIKDAALAAIKVHMNMYYSVKQDNKKKVK